jgi:hypothetical protein
MQSIKGIFAIVATAAVFTVLAVTAFTKETDASIIDYTISGVTNSVEDFGISGVYSNQPWSFVLSINSEASDSAESPLIGRFSSGVLSFGLVFGDPSDDPLIVSGDSVVDFWTNNDLGLPQTDELGLLIWGNGNIDSQIGGDPFGQLISIDFSFSEQGDNTTLNSDALLPALYASEEGAFPNSSVQFVFSKPSGLIYPLLGELFYLVPISSSIDNVDIQLVPEPTTVVLLGIGLVGIAGIMARRKCRKESI